MVFAEWQVGQVLWSMVWFTVFFLWIWLVIRVFADIFRSKDIGGVSKTLWTLFVLFTPYLGVFVYLVARGGGMADRDRAVLAAQDQAVREYIRDAVAPSNGHATELAQLVDLRDRGAIDDSEFQAMKRKILVS
jgi:hypothetical protein